MRTSHGEINVLAIGTDPQPCLVYVDRYGRCYISKKACCSASNACAFISISRRFEFRNRSLVNPPQLQHHDSAIIARPSTSKLSMGPGILEQRLGSKLAKVVGSQRRVARQHEPVTVSLAGDALVDGDDAELAELLANKPGHLARNVAYINIGSMGVSLAMADHEDREWTSILPVSSVSGNTATL